MTDARTKSHNAVTDARTKSYKAVTDARTKSYKAVTDARTKLYKAWTCKDQVMQDCDCQEDGGGYANSGYEMDNVNDGE